MASLEDSNALLIFRVGPVFCCAPSLPVEAIIQPPHLTHPPGTSAARPGIFKHGKHLVSVVDLRHRFGVAEHRRDKPGRMIITRLENKYIGFWVDQIIDVIEMPQQSWSKLPPHLPRGIFSRTLLLQDVIHLYAEFAKLATLQQAGYLREYIEQLEQLAAKPTPGDVPASDRAGTSTDLSHEYNKAETQAAAVVDNNKANSHRQTGSIKSIKPDDTKPGQAIEVSAAKQVPESAGSLASIDGKTKQPPAMKRQQVEKTALQSTRRTDLPARKSASTAIPREQSEHKKTPDNLSRGSAPAPGIKNKSIRHKSVQLKSVTGKHADTSLLHSQSTRHQDNQRKGLLSATEKTAPVRAETPSAVSKPPVSDRVAKDTPYAIDKREGSGGLAFMLIALLFLLLFVGTAYYLLFDDTEAMPDLASVKPVMKEDRTSVPYASPVNGSLQLESNETDEPQTDATDPQADGNEADENRPDDPGETRPVAATPEARSPDSRIPETRVPESQITATHTPQSEVVPATSGQDATARESEETDEPQTDATDPLADGKEADENRPDDPGETRPVTTTPEARSPDSRIPESQITATHTPQSEAVLATSRQDATARESEETDEPQTEATDPLADGKEADENRPDDPGENRPVAATPEARIPESQITATYTPQSKAVLVTGGQDATARESEETDEPQTEATESQADGKEADKNRPDDPGETRPVTATPEARSPDSRIPESQITATHTPQSEAVSVTGGQETTARESEETGELHTEGTTRQNNTGIDDIKTNDSVTQQRSSDRVLIQEDGNNSSEYHASIQRDQTGITIILTEPEGDIDIAATSSIPAEIVKENKTAPQTTDVLAKSEATPAQTLPEETNRIEPSSKTAQTGEETPEPAPQQTITSQTPGKKEITLQQTTQTISRHRRIIKITHTVIKGDTLWHIAKRYVKNPYLYPELARLSNIKNPHLIYPGDKVHIIRYRP